MESTLTFDFQGLYQDVAEFDGLGRSVTGAGLATAKRRVNDGYRMFLAAHDWNFLKQNSVLIARGYEEELPDNFTDLIIPFKYSPTDGGEIMQETDDAAIIQLREGSNRTTGRPYKFALRPKKYTTGTSSIRWEVVFFPAPDAVYPLEYSYHILVNKLVNDDDAPVCGAEHSQTLRAYCLAEVESFDKEMADVWTTKLPLLLAQSIKKDGKKSARSVGVMSERDVGYYRVIEVQYNNILY